MSSCSSLITWGRTSFSSQRSTASSRAASSAGSAAGYLVVGLGFEVACVSLNHEDGAVELADLHLVLIEAERLDRHDAGARATLRVALVEHLGLGVQRVAGKERVREPDVGPAEIRDRLLADIGHAHADHERDGERAAHHAAPELAVARVLLVEMQRVRVHREKREGDIVILGDGAPGAVLVDVADAELLVVATETFAIGARAYLFRFA